MRERWISFGEPEGLESVLFGKQGVHFCAWAYVEVVDGQDTIPMARSNFNKVVMRIVER
jgi:hypothetical protein